MVTEQTISDHLNLYIKETSPLMITVTWDYPGIILRNDTTGWSGAAGMD